MSSIIYLAGPINGCTDAEVYDWRDDMTSRLSDHTVISPMSRDYRGKEDQDVADIVEGDKRAIDSSDIVIAYCPRPSAGTSMEILYAWEHDKYVVLLLPVRDGASISPWLRYHSHTVHSSAAAAAREIKGFIREAQMIGSNDRSEVITPKTEMLVLDTIEALKAYHRDCHRREPLDYRQATVNQLRRAVNELEALGS